MLYREHAFPDLKSPLWQYFFFLSLHNIAYMAVNEKSDNLEYYIVHPEEMASGVEDFLDYLKSMKWIA